MARIEFPLGAIPVTGSDDFTIIDELAVLGRIVNPSGSLVLSSSVGSDTVVSGNLHVKGGGSVTVDGNVTVGGTVTFVSSSNLVVHDPLIILAVSQSAIAPQFDSGFIVERGTGENRAFIWRETDSRFAAVTTDETGSTAGTIPIKGYSPLKVRDLVLHSGTVTADNGYLILSSSVGSTVFVSGTLIASQRLAVSGTIHVAGSSIVGVTLTNTHNRVLRLAADDGGSAILAAQNFTENGNLANLGASGLDLYAASRISWNDLTNSYSTGLKEINLLNGRYYGSVTGRTAQSGTLTLSSSAPGASVGITAHHSHLIFSSSEGSKIFVSGALTSSEGIHTPGQSSATTLRGVDVNSGRLTLSNAIVATPYATINQGSDYLFAWTGGTFRKAGYLSDIEVQWKSTTTGDATSRAGDDTGVGRQSPGVIYVSGTQGHGGLTANKGHLILSSSVGSQITTSGTLKVIYDPGSSFDSEFAIERDRSENVGVGSIIRFRGTGASGARVDYGLIGARKQAAGNTNNGFITFQTHDGTSLTEKYRILTDGIVDARAGHFILSSSAGSTTTVSGALKTIDSVTIQYHPADFAARLVYRSNTGGFLGSVIADSAGVHIDNTGFNTSLNINANKVRIGASVSTGFPIVETLDVSGSILLQQPHRALIHATGSHLILSSSVDSQIVVSGNLYIQPPQAIVLPTTNGNGVVLTNGSVVIGGNSQFLFSSRPGGIFSTTVSPTNVGLASYQDNVVRITNGSDKTGSLDVGGYVNNTSGSLILSSSFNSTVVVSGTLTLKGNTSAVALTVGNNGSISTPRIDVTDNNDGSLAMTNGGTVAYGHTSGFVWSNQASGGGTKITRVSQLGTGSIGLSGALGTVTLAATTGHLVLSSSVGSTITVSGTIIHMMGSEIQFRNGGGHINDISQITTDGSQVMHLASDGGNIRLRPSTARLQFDGDVSVTGALDITGSVLPYHVRATNSHLILSSSVGSVVFVSGTLSGAQGASFNSNVLIATQTTNPLRVQTSTDAALTLRSTNTAGDIFYTLENTGDNEHAWAFGRPNNGDFVINHSTGGTYPSGVTTTRMRVSASGETYFSASITSLTGALKLGRVATAGDLPIGEAYSGSMFWVESVKAAAIYGPEGWTRILTGTL